MNSAAAGLVSGFAAASPMGAAMSAFQRLFDRGTRRALPPESITRRAAARAGLPDAGWTAISAHHAFGAAMGLLYAALPGSDRRPLLKGTAFGLAVWAANYAGLMPALTLYPPAWKETPRRNAVLVLSHAVWGASLGFLYRRLACRPR